jgi:hypothetical protein
MFIVFKKSPVWYKFWKDVEYSIAPVDPERTISDDDDDDNVPDQFIPPPDNGYRNLPVFMIRVVANLDVNAEKRLELATMMKCDLVK